MYQPIWRQLAFNAMERLVPRYPHMKSEFSSTLKAITKELSERPHGAGESRFGGLRVFFPGRLTVYFKIDDLAKTVHILNLGMRKSKPN